MKQRGLPAEILQNRAILTGLDEAGRVCEMPIGFVDHNQFKIAPLAARRYLPVHELLRVCQKMQNRDFIAMGFYD